MGRLDPRPPDWEAAFGRRAPIEVDLGCGRGNYVIERARRSPGIDLVAVDTKRRWIGLIRERAARESLTNLRAIRCDVRCDLPLLFAGGSVSGFTLHHPDPWWKKRHRKRRLVQADFVDQLSRYLVEGGWVYVQSDVPDLAEEIRSAFLACPSFCAIDAQVLLHDVLGAVQSHRAEKCARLGIPIRRLAFRRVVQGPPEP